MAVTSAVLYLAVAAYSGVLLASMPWKGWWTFSPLFIISLAFFLAARVWSLGMYLTDHSLVCRNWIRAFEVRFEEIESIRIYSVSTMLTGTFIGWVPFIGRVGMIVIFYKSGERKESYSATNVYGRERLMRSVAKEVADAAGVKQSFF
ncbi:hypothetical protein [Microbacterium binotii]|uniref:hypothetical protein n=1 Tax=Microbacterium binotii TaxID=462710 RepID=UPI001F47F712|nr:hypothetical protein [Microbacterium binotii]UIN30347.1 hypothetical protein LXM64_14575 [Microbacterium binotii]